MHTEGIYAEIPIHKIKPGENFLAGNGFPYIKVATCTQTPAPGHWGVHLTTGDLQGFAETHRVQPIKLKVVRR
ncbi:hypothetical protein LCGC14_2817710 [marine sediment metagenome]|uniref:Uncharacterized protein n=1 Tax=marine sediment metagenome TaxID=412755 RepID=A0A0F8Z4U1_9ZZZZ